MAVVSSNGDLALDQTHDPQRKSWLEVPDESDFPIQNLPFGVFSRDGGAARIGVAIGERILDLRACAEAGLLADTIESAIVARDSLNALMESGRVTWRALRARLSDLLSLGGDDALRSRPAALCAASEATMHLPARIGDYVDFYSSLEHATNLGRIFRPNGDPLLPNWRWIPIGYHGRSATIVLDGTDIRRPQGQRKAPDSSEPSFGPSTRLDIELEIGFFGGPGNKLGEAIPIEHARERIFGCVLVNDWSARDIQAWEYQPLGPFLGKSFATTISPWVVTLEALEPFRVAGPTQQPPPLPYLAGRNTENYAISLCVELSSAAMRERGERATTISRTNFSGMYWSQVQQLAHATSNGACVRAGDLFASGTISGSAAGTQGSLIELTENGANPIPIAADELRGFLLDGDEVTLKGRAVSSGRASIGFGSARGRIVARSA